jgi:6-phosphogluconolactonase (cycloisomerase 2 family)
LATANKNFSLIFARNRRTKQLLDHNIVRKAGLDTFVQWRSFVKIQMTALLVVAGLGLSGCPFGAKYTVGGTLVGLAGTGLVLQDNAGNNLSLTSNGTFNFSTGLTNNSAYSVTVSTQPSDPVQTCTVRNGSGTIDKATVSNIIVVCTQPGLFAYVANELSNDVSAFIIDSSTGELSPVAGSPFASTGSTPVALTVDPDGTFLYVANNTTNSISIFSIDSASGVLTAQSIGANTGNGPDAVTMDPAGHFLFVANATDNTVSVFSVASGVLTAVTGSPFVVGTSPSSLQVDPNGNYLYVANFGSADISVFAIDSTTGTLTSIAGSPFGAGTEPYSIAIDPTGSYAYVSDETGAGISEYAVNPTTGALSVVSGSPLATTSQPLGLAADPQGKFIYAANVTTTNAVSSYSIAPTTGVLAVASTLASGGTLPVSLAVDPSGLYLYVASRSSNSLSVLAINPATGALTAVAGSPYATDSGANAVAID